MKRYLAFLFALLALPALADAVFKDDNVTVRLQNKPCEAPVAPLILPAVLPQSKAGVATWQGRQVKLCWAILNPGYVTIVDEDGDGGLLPLGDFKAEPGA